MPFKDIRADHGSDLVAEIFPYMCEIHQSAGGFEQIGFGNAVLLYQDLADIPAFFGLDTRGLGKDFFIDVVVVN